MANGSSGGRGLNLTAKLDVAAAKKNAQDLLKTLKELKIAASEATTGNTGTPNKAFNVKPLTEYQAGLLKIKQEAIELAKQNAADKKARQEQADAERSASLATQAALKEEARLKREQISLQKQAAAEANKKKPTQVSNSQAEIDAYKRAQQGSVLYTSAINNEMVARAKLNAEAAKAAVANGSLTASGNQYTQSTTQQTAATNQNVLSKKQLAQMLAEEKLRQADATKELKNNAREMLNAKGSLEQRRAALIRLLTVYDRLSKAERESAAGKRLENIISGLTGQISALENATGRAQRGVGSYADGIRAFFASIKDNILTTLGPIALLTAAFAAAKSAFNHNVEISDNFTDVQRTAKLSKEEVREFGKELKNLDTRSSLEGLLDIGFIGGRLAVPKKDLEDFVKQVDELAVVLKKEFPGGAEAVAESLGKIVTIYKVTQKEGVSLGTALSKVGSNLLELAHSGPVTVKYLQDFTLGVAGTAVSAKLTIPVISAYGAVLGEAGQMASSSALSVTRLVTGLTTKTGKYFAIAQLADSTLTIEKFTKIVNTDTKQALDLFFKGLNAGNPVATEFAARLGSVGITTGKVTNAVKILAENQDKLANRIGVGSKAFEEGTSVAHNFELANDNLAASVDKLHNAAVNLITDPNSSLAGFFKGIIDGSTYAIKAISDLSDALDKEQEKKDLDLLDRAKPTLYNSLFMGQAIDPKELAAARARVKAAVSQSLNDDIAGRGYATADNLSAGKGELEIRKLLTGEINKQKIAVDRLGNALAFVSNPKNTEAQTAVVEKSINKLREAARQQSAVVAGLRKRLPTDTTVYGDGSLVNQEESGDRTIEDIKSDIKQLTEANKKLGTQTALFKANRDKLIALRKELKLANGGKDTEGISAENQYQSALKSRNDLQTQISALTKKGTDKQLSADEQELESVRDKYKKMADAAAAFNKNPKNKGLKVNSSGMLTAQSQEEDAVRDKQDTAKLKVTLDEQKKLYDAYEEYKTKVGEDKAKERYGKLIDTDRTYLESLQAQQDALLSPQKSKGGEEGKASALKIKLLGEEIAAEKILVQKRDDEIYADAYQAALTNGQKLEQINQDYNRRRKALGDNATAEQLENLQKERDERIRTQNEANSVARSGYADLMRNWDELTRGEIKKRLEIIKEGYRKDYKEGKLTAEQLSDKIKEINGRQSGLDGDNAFSKIVKSIKEYKKQIELTGKDSEGAKEAQELMFSTISDGAQAAGQIVGELASSFEQLGIGGEDLQKVFKDVQGIIGGAGTLAKGLATGNPVDIITGSIKLLTSAIDLFNNKDRKLQKQIDAYKTQLDSLGKAYKQLERDVNNSVGESYYSDSAKQIDNLKAQQAELIKMRDAERSKKKADQSKITDYQNQIDDIPNQIADINKAISENLIQTNFKDLSNNLADAFSDAFAAAEDSANKFDDVFNQVIVNAVKNSLKLKILDPIVKKFTDDLTAYAQGNDNSVIGFDFEKYRVLLKAGGDLVTAGLEKIKDYFPEVEDTATATAKTGISGAIVGEAITEGTANRLLGITLAQHDSIKLMGKSIADTYKVTVNNFNVTVEIAANTLRTANNTDGIAAKLDKIVENTGGSDDLGQALRNAGVK